MQENTEPRQITTYRDIQDAKLKLLVETKDATIKELVKQRD